MNDFNKKCMCGEGERLEKGTTFIHQCIHNWIVWNASLPYFLTCLIKKHRHHWSKKVHWKASCISSQWMSRNRSYPLCFQWVYRTSWKWLFRGIPFEYEFIAFALAALRISLRRVTRNWVLPAPFASRNAMPLSKSLSRVMDIRTKAFYCPQRFSGFLRLAVWRLLRR